MHMRAEPARARKPPLGQVVFCTGCCCGRTDRGFAPVPVARLKAVWRAEKLNRTIQLTISGCLGPCDMANVAMILTPQEVLWFRNLDQETFFDAVIAWARACHAVHRLLQWPEVLASQRFEWFAETARGNGRPVPRPVAVEPAVARKE